METLLPGFETFVGIITSIQEQDRRQDEFAEKIKKAYIEAGECDDFREAPAYTPATQVFIENILQYLAYMFVSEYQTYNEALDHINYFMYELSLMDYQFVEPVDSNEEGLQHLHFVPAYYHSKTGEVLPLATPEDLYHSLIYEMTHPAKTNEE